MRSETLTALRRETPDIRSTLIVVVLTVLGVSATWSVGSGAVVLILLCVSYVFGLIGAISLFELFKLPRYRRLERLAMTALPVTPMVMRLHHSTRVPAGGYPERHYWSAYLGYPQDIESQPSRRASESTTQTEDPFALFFRPGRVLPVALVVPLFPTDDFPFQNDVDPTDVDIPVEVLGTPEHGQEVLILTATGILWPKAPAHSPSPPLTAVWSRLGELVLVPEGASAPARPSLVGWDVTRLLLMESLWVAGGFLLGGPVWVVATIAVVLAALWLVVCMSGEPRINVARRLLQAGRVSKR